jgi:hypothetical protein
LSRKSAHVVVGATDIKKTAVEFNLVSITHEFLTEKTAGACVADDHGQAQDDEDLFFRATSRGVNTRYAN